MPNYDYRCKECGFTFELQTTIAERDAPTMLNCPECQTTEAFERVLLSAPGIGDPMRIRGAKGVPDSFKDILRNMKKKHKHSTINTL